MAFEDQLKAGKNFKAPKGYKPMSTKDKLIMAGTAGVGGKVIKAVSRTAGIIKSEAKVAGAAKSYSKARALTGPSASKNSVYQLPGRPSGVKAVPASNAADRASKNVAAAGRNIGAKSGATARVGGQRQESWNKMNPKGKKPTVKINTNPSKGK